MRQLARAVVAAVCAVAPQMTSAAAEPAADHVLTLQDALTTAKTDQPLIEANEREAQASEQAALAARSLPDLQLTAGVQNFPVTGSNSFSPTNDFMTMYTIGVMREQVRRSKREAEANRILADALVSRTQASAEERQIRRSVMLAWIRAVEARAKRTLLERMITDLRSGRKVMEAAIPTGGSTPALALQTDAEIALEQSQFEDAKRAEAHARAELARWIGDAAYLPLPLALPKIEVPLEMTPPAVARHPEVQVALAQQRSAERQVNVAREARAPDISWSVMAGFRPRFGQMVSGSISVPLQLNRRNKQDRLVSEAQARADAAHLRAVDKVRELQRDYDAAVADYKGAEAELQRIDRDALPALESAFKAAEARYAAGGGTLDEPFGIVRRYIETGIKSVEAEARRAQAAAEILYVEGETHQ